MRVNFLVKGRLGNAIYRYIASSLFCIVYNYEYVINESQNTNLTDSDFYKIFILKNKNHNNESINMFGYYQHDTIYQEFKNSIIDFINKNPSHYIETDGIKAGDRNKERFLMKDILTTPTNFKKKYKYVLHLRLEDRVCNWYIPKERIINLLKNIKLEDTLCIVFNKIETEFEISYINYIVDFLKQKNINFIMESNDVLTDYYIMKEAEILICSNSTLSWCAAYFSDKIQICYFPDYNSEDPESISCKSPINNTIIY